MPASVTLPGSSLAVDPGSSASVALSVRNTGSVVDEFFMTVLGDTTAWTTVEPASLSLFPGAEGQVQVVFRPPRAPSARAGDIPVGIRVQSIVDATFSVVEEVRVRVGTFREYEARLVPRTSRARRAATHQVAIKNLGNDILPVAVSAFDPDERLEVDVQPSAAEVPVEGQRMIRVRVTAKERRWTGSSEMLPFRVTVTPGGAPLTNLDGVFQQGRVLPGTRSVLGLGAALLLLAGGALAASGNLRFDLTGSGGGSDATTEPTLPPTPTASAPPTPTPTSEPITPVPITLAPSTPAPVTPPPDPCGPPLEIERFNVLVARDPQVTIDEPICLVSMTLFLGGPALGDVILTVDQGPLFFISLEGFDAIGVPGAGSGERFVQFETPIALAPGRLVALDFSACTSACGELSVTLESALQR
jgi:hypothetical protein